MRRFRGPSRRASSGGFTLLELIFVASMIGILAAIAMPNLIQTPRRAKEAVLKTNLRTLREVIDQHHGDKGFYPPTLEVLEEEGYVRAVPLDPLTNEREWQLIFEDDSEDFDTDDGWADDSWDDFDEDLEETGPGIIDVHSLSPDIAIDGSNYSEW